MIYDCKQFLIQEIHAVGDFEPSIELGLCSDAIKKSSEFLWESAASAGHEDRA